MRCQGGWETDESVEVAASRETVEEAGVRGRLEVHSGLVAFESAAYMSLAVTGCASLAFWVLADNAEVRFLAFRTQCWVFIHLSARSRSVLLAETRAGAWHICL